MTDIRTFLVTAASHLKRPLVTTESEFAEPGGKSFLRSWCSWTIYDRLKRDAGYWTAQLPLEEELADKNVKDGGNWGQPFVYDEIAHIIIPRHFEEQYMEGRRLRWWTHEQDLEGLAARLDEAKLPFRMTNLLLELKLY